MSSEIKGANFMKSSLLRNFSLLMSILTIAFTLSFKANAAKTTIDLDSIINQTANASIQDYLKSSSTKNSEIDKIVDEASNFIATNGKTMSPTLAKIIQKTRTKIVHDKGLKAGAQTTDMDIAYAVQFAAENISVN